MKISFFLYIIFTFLLYSQESSAILVSSNTINISKHDNNVKHNLRLAIKKISGHKFSKGQVFSFNKVVGEASLLNGYVPARVFDLDEVGIEPGGGICIIASSIFNAMLLSGNDIVERYKHSRPVSYIAPGLDATILYGKRDLKMKNNSKNDFYLQGELTDRSLTIKIYSDSPLEFEYEIQNVIQENSHIDTENANALTVKVYRMKQNELQYLYSDTVHPVKK